MAFTNAHQPSSAQAIAAGTNATATAVYSILQRAVSLITLHFTVTSDYSCLGDPPDREERIRLRQRYCQLPIFRAMLGAQNIQEFELALK